MTEKRFELNKIVKVGTVSFWDNENQKIVNATAALNLLNELSEENKQLKTELENTISMSYLKEVLQSNLEWWRKEYNPIDESLVIEINMIKSIAEDLGVELE